MSHPFGRLLSFEGMMGCLQDVLEELPDKRRGRNAVYGMKDIGLGAFAVFFTQNPSFLAFQRAMDKTKGRSNARTLFGMERIPSDNHIRKLLDAVSPESLFGVFSTVFDGLESAGHLQDFRTPSGELLVALDGTEYFSSPTIHCEKCSRRVHRNGGVTYSHQAITPVVVTPDRETVISLEPEFITPQDGHEKQDCETAAAKRWLARYGERYRESGVTLLGDDLYSRQPLCQAILEAGLSFVLVCKPDSHPTLYDWLDGMELETVQVERWTGKRHEIDTYRFVNRVPLRDAEPALGVNWCELITTDRKGNVLYRNAFVTNHPISRECVAELVGAGRARWKVENENNNVLKTKGYHLEHNYGHGEQHLASVLVTLNLLAFLFHTVLDHFDTAYHRVREALPGRRTFFDDLRALTRYTCFSSWRALLVFMLEGLELEVPDTG